MICCIHCCQYQNEYRAALPLNTSFYLAEESAETMRNERREKLMEEAKRKGKYTPCGYSKFAPARAEVSAKKGWSSSEYAWPFLTQMTHWTQQQAHLTSPHKTRPMWISHLEATPCEEKPLDLIKWPSSLPPLLLKLLPGVEILLPMTLWFSQYLPVSI